MIAAEQLGALWKRPRARPAAKSPIPAPISVCAARPLLSDYTWNHTTLWAMKADDAYTYLQCGFDPGYRARADSPAQGTVRRRDSVSHGVHEEWRRGRVIPGAIPVVYFTTEERLNEMIDFCREIGVFVANPHVNNVEGGGRYRADNVQLLAKQRYDPKGLLNPGKMVTFRARRSQRRRRSSDEDLDPRLAQFRLSQLEAGRRAAARDPRCWCLPTAAIEQHGHHLPLATDTLINNLLLGHALEKLAAGVARLRAAARVLRQEQRAHRLSRHALGERFHIHGRAARSGREHCRAPGFKKLVLYNTHGGNTSLIDVMARDLRAEFGLRTFALHGSGGIPASKASARRSAPTDFMRAKWKRLFCWLACRNSSTAPPTP